MSPVAGRRRIALAVGRNNADDDRGTMLTATVARIYANGLVDVSFGPGRIATSCAVLSTYTPASGDVVQLLRRDDASWVVLGPHRLSNPTTVDVGRSWSFPYNITPAAPGVSNPYVVSVSATRSWRGSDQDRWGGAYLPATDTVAQGAYSTSNDFYRGCYFYGDGAFSALAGRRCTRLRIKLIRLSSGGSSAATQQILAPHAHGSVPGQDPPFFVASNYFAGSIGWGGSGVFDLPVDWGQRLIDGSAKGIGHNLLAYGNGNYSLNAGKTADATTGQLTIDWA